MKISELQAALSKVSSIVGDANVVLTDGAGVADQVVTAITISLNPSGSQTGDTVTVVYGQPPAATSATLPELATTGTGA